MRGSGYSPDSLPRAYQRSEKPHDRRVSRRRSPCHETAAAPVLWCPKMPIRTHRRVPPKLESRNSRRTCGTIKSGTDTYTGSQTERIQNRREARTRERTHVGRRIGLPLRSRTPPEVPSAGTGPSANSSARPQPSCQPNVGCVVCTNAFQLEMHFNSLF